MARLAMNRPLYLGLLLFGFAGCTSMATRWLSESLSQAIVNHDDPATVQAGAPAYLLLLDGFIDESPDDADLLIAGARLNGVYATVFVEDPERARHLSGKARA